MAKARMLHKKISISQQVNNLSLPTQLLFTWMIAHADDEGRLRGESDYIRATVVPMKNWSPKRIERYLEEIKSVNLIYRWEHNDEWIIEFIRWNEHQIIRKDRFTSSNLLSFPNKNDVKVSTKRQPENDQETLQSNPIESNLIKGNSMKASGADSLTQKPSSKGMEKLRKTLKEKGIIR